MKIAAHIALIQSATFYLPKTNLFPRPPSQNKKINQNRNSVSIYFVRKEGKLLFNELKLIFVNLNCAVNFLT